MNELTDAEVMTAPAPPQEFSDADVMKPAAPAAAAADLTARMREGVKPFSVHTIDSRDPDQQAAVQRSSVGRVWNAFMDNGKTAFGDRPLGMSDTDLKWFQDNLGMFRKGTEQADPNPFRAFADGIFFNAAKPLDWTLRQLRGVGAGIMGGAHEVGGIALEHGAPSDLAAILALEYVPAHAGIRAPAPSAVISQMRGMPIMRTVANARDLGVIGPPRPPLAEMKPAEAAAEAARPGVINAYHGSPHDFDAFSIEHIGTGEGAQSYGHGLYFAEKIYETRPLPQGSLYQVRIHANPEHMLDWDKPLSEQPRVAAAFERAWEKAGEPPPRKGWKSMQAQEAYDYLSGLHGQDAASAMLAEQGVPGIRYLDQGSRRGMIEAPEKIAGRLEEIGARLDQIKSLSSEKQTKAIHDEFETLSNEKARLQDELTRYRESQQTRNFVVFDDKHVEITHKNGEPVAPQMSGPEPAPSRTMAAARTGDDVLRGPEPEGQPNTWRARFDEFTRKVSTSEDAQKVLQQAADQGNEFPAARAGNIPLRQVDDLAAAAGVEPSTVNADGVGRLLKNDSMVRNAMQAMMTARDDVIAASHDVGLDPSPANLMKLEEALQRRNMWVEQVVGHRAEWGRTGNVFQEFMRSVKDEESFSQYLKDKGRSPDDLRDVADAVNSTSKENAARVLSELNARQPGWVWYTWVNGLISGLLTHTKYLAANALTMATEHGVTTPLAALIGAAKKVVGLGADADRVFFGETMAGTYGWMSAAPHAIMAAARAIKTGARPAMESEIALRDAMVARGEKIPFTLNRAVNPVTGTTNQPQGRFLGLFGPETKTAQVAAKVIGVPGQSAGAIHFAFKLMNEQASKATEAYRLAGQEGLSPTEAQFWTRKAEHEANLPPEALARTIEASYKGTFMGELGPKGKAFQRFVKEVPGLRWLFPFTHIPVNLMSATIEHTPLAVLDQSLRNDLAGRNGGVKQDKAIARMVVGSSIMGWFTMKALNGEATGDLPRAQDERDQWLLEGKQPNSIRIGNNWVSFQRFGPAGNLASIGANMAQVIHYLQAGDNEAMTKATYHSAEAAARIVVDEVGFQSLANMFEAYHDPDRRGVAWVASTASSFIPFSSLLSQQASFMDPHMRQAKTLVDGLKYRIPLAREALLPKRDWTGEPIANPAYHSILRTREANQDPVAAEMKALQIHPGVPEDRISGVKLTPELYDRYAATAGALTMPALEYLVNQPGWSSQPAIMRETAIRKMIEATRKAATVPMLTQYPELIQEALRQRVDHITGAAPTARPKKSPAALEGLR